MTHDDRSWPARPSWNSGRESNALEYERRVREMKAVQEEALFANRKFETSRAFKVGELRSYVGGSSRWSRALEAVRAKDSGLSRSRASAGRAPM
jgi:hypothetical protein